MQWRAQVWWCPGRLLDWMPLPNSSIEQWRMVVIVTEHTLLVTSPYDVIFKFATNVLAKFFDTTCTFSDAGAAVGCSGETDGGQGGQPPPLAGHFEVFGPPVTTLLILLSDL